MTQTMQSVIRRLESWPEPQQERFAPQIHAFLTKLEQLRELVQEGLDEVERGDVVTFDADDIIRRGEARLAARRTEAL